MIDLELDVDALQPLAGEEAGLEFESRGVCTASCDFTCFFTCFITG
jgi:hypothetical protein